MHTEEEANGKWCPMGMVDERDSQKCTGSTCMAWRWDEDRSVVLADGTYRKVGYCGLAGKP